MTPFFPDSPTCARVAAEHELPLFLTSESHLRQQAREALAFPHAFGLTVRYAMKTNPNRNILRIFDDMGIAIDASSEYEARRAMAAGIAPDRIQLTAQEYPRDILSLVRAGIRYNATSLGQLERYGEAFPGTEVGIRVNPGIGSGSTARTNV